MDMRKLKIVYYTFSMTNLTKVWKAYLDTSQTFVIELQKLKAVNYFLKKSLIIDASLCSRYTSDYTKKLGK